MALNCRLEYVYHEGAGKSHGVTVFKFIDWQDIGCNPHPSPLPEGEGVIVLLKTKRAL